MPGLDWRIGGQAEEESWDPEPPATGRRVSGRRRRPLLLSAALLLILLGGAIWQLRRLTDQAVQQATESALASLDLVDFAVDRSDLQIYGRLLFSRRPQWVELQRELLSRKLVSDRYPLGLHLQDTKPQNVSVKLSPDLNVAEIQREHQYAVWTGGGGPELVTLRQTVVFEAFNQYWLRVEPEAEFWGDWLEYQGRHLTVRYPERDAAIGRRLGADLDNQLIATCQILPDLDCPSTMNVKLRLAKDADSLIQMADRQATIHDVLALEMPAPTLVGIPVDEAGYQALYRGYAAHLTAAVIARQVGWTCCASAVFFQALLDKQLAVLGLKPWPLSTADYDRWAAHYFRLPGLNAALRATSVDELDEADRWRVYSFTDFLVENAASATISYLQRQVAQATNHLDWSRQVLGEDAFQDKPLGRAWLEHAYERTSYAQMDAPVPLPAGDANLYCLSERDSALYRYAWSSDTWQTSYLLDNELDGLISPLPGTSGVLLEQHRSSNLDRNWTLIRQDGATVEVPVNLGSFAYPRIGDASLLKEKIITLGPERSGNGLAKTGEPGSQLRLLDLGQCNSAGCSSTPLSGLPVWSPDSAYTLFNAKGSGQDAFALVLGDGAGQTLVQVGEGHLPFWMDDVTYGFVSARNGQEAIVSGVVIDNYLETLLTAGEIIAALPEQPNPQSLKIRQVVPSPANHELLLLDVFAPELQAQYILSYNRATGELILDFRQVDGASFIELTFSPDGRWWSLLTYDGDDLVDATWAFHLHDIKQRETQFLAFNPIPFPAHSYGWTADSNWFLKLDAGFITLVAPSSNYQKMIVVDPGFCTSAVWVHNP